MRQVTIAQQLIRTTILPSHTHHHYVRTLLCLQLLLTSLPRRARAAGLLLRLPASQPEQTTARSAVADHVGGEEAARRGRPRGHPRRRMLASRALGELCLVAPATHVGGRGV